MKMPIVGWAVLLAVLAPLAAKTAEPSQEVLRAGYERLYSGDPDGAYEHFRALAQAAPDNLAAAYGVLFALSKRVRTDESLSKELEDRAEQILHKAEARYANNSRDREALFYLANTYALRAGYRFRHNKGIWGAARDGAKSKSYSDAYVKADPGRADAYLALGFYNYYVDIAPNFVKVLRIFLFLPGGNRQEGLKQIERAAREGQLFAAEAQSELTQIYGWMEGRPDDALRVAEALEKKYADNPAYQFQLAALYTHPQVEEPARAAEKYRSIARRAEEGNPQYKGGTRYNAVLGLARVSQQQWRLDEAIKILDPLIQAGVADPGWVMPRLLLARANFRAMLNDPAATEDARRILSNGQWKRWHPETERWLKQVEKRKQAGELAVFAALIPGNRLVAERRWDEALQSYQRVRQQFPDDWQVRYRLAYLEFACGNLTQAATGFGAIANSNPGRMPDWVKADSLLHLARTHDLRGERDQATKLYKKVADSFEHESAAQAARVGLMTPYQRRVLAVSTAPSSGRPQ